MNHIIMDAPNVLWWTARQHLEPLTLTLELEYKTDMKEVWVRERHRQHLSAGGQSPAPGDQPHPPTSETGEKTQEEGAAIAQTRAVMSGSAEADGCVWECSLSPGSSVWVAAQSQCIRRAHEAGFLPCGVLKPNNIFNLQFGQKPEHFTPIHCRKR